MTTRIIGCGSALPKKIITNDDLAQIMDTSDEWIRTRSGICERRLAGEEETTVTLAAEAGRKALEDAKTAPEEIELLLVATCSSECYFPSVACQVQGILGLHNAAAMDLSAACSGFLFALNTAHAYIKSGIYKKALLIGSETLSKLIDWKDRSTCVLFGDGAGACVAEASQTGILDMIQHSDGTMGHVLKCSASTQPTPAASEKEMEPLSMEGQPVFKFAVKTVPECIHTLLERNQKDPKEIDQYILHQANSRIIQSVAKRLGVEEEKFPMNLNTKGNTSAASIPILLDELKRQGKLKKGDTLVLSGFGAGLTWGATLIQW